MLREMLRAKVHRATVTETRVDYHGSLTLDADLMQAAGMLPFERVDLYNADNGARLSTYVIPGEAGKGDACVNGAAARLASVGDRIIIASYASLTPEEIPSHRPTVVLVNDRNRIEKIVTESMAVIEVPA